MKIFIGYDHNGVKLAGELMEYLLGLGHEINEPFDNNKEDDDYPDISKPVCDAVLKTKNSVGILICGTGIGITMSANRQKGIRAVLAQTTADAYFSKRHENANVLVFAAGYTDGKVAVKGVGKKAEKIIDVFLSTPFEGDRHIRRIEKLDNIN